MRSRAVVLVALLAILVQTLVPNFAMASAGRSGGLSAIGLSDLLTGDRGDLLSSWCGDAAGDEDARTPAMTDHQAPCAFCLVQSGVLLPPDRQAEFLAFRRTGPPAGPPPPSGLPLRPFLSNLSPRAPPAV